MKNYILHPIQALLYDIDHVICPTCEEKVCKLYKHMEFHVHTLDIFEYLWSTKEYGL